MGSEMCIRDRNHQLLEAQAEQEKVEQKLRAALAEKEVMMREMHHRVKNNLQMMSALLELQASYVPDEQTRAYFRDSQLRIGSMALIHEQIYGSGNLAEIDFAAYLHSLVENLHGQFGALSSQVKMVINAQACNLPVDTAIPCGLVLNELVSNVFRHAFPDGRTGELRVSLECAGKGAGKVVLEVADDGVGLPPDLDLQHVQTFGLHLIELMVKKQLHGKLSIESSHGTRVRCEIGVAK